MNTILDYVRLFSLCPHHTLTYIITFSFCNVPLENAPAGFHCYLLTLAANTEVTDSSSTHVLALLIRETTFENISQPEALRRFHSALLIEGRECL
jgi:hypothetical protein